MKIIKLDHSCLIINKDEHNLLIDPVEFNTKIPDITNLDAIIITHKHADHFQTEVLEKILSAHPNAELFIAEDMVDEINRPAKITNSGENVQVGEFKLSFFGHDHAPIVDGVSPCRNFGVIIDDCFVNPGDSFDDPKVDNPKALFVAISAPWLKVEEAMRYISAVKPQKVIPVHDALLSPLGHKITDNWIKKSCDENGAEYLILNPGESAEIF